MAILLVVVGCALAQQCTIDGGDEQSPADNSSCKEGFDEGLVTGPDYRACVCCGGWFVEINGNKYLMPSPTHFDTTLALYQMPVPVCLRWKKREQPCLGNEIVVSELIVR